MFSIEIFIKQNSAHSFNSPLGENYNPLTSQAGHCITKPILLLRQIQYYTANPHSRWILPLLGTHPHL